MSNFSYAQYQDVIARAQSGENGGNSTKIGFFKMKNDKDEALVRFNVASLDNLQFATVHQLGAAQKWMKISCLNPVGSYQSTCPLCAAVAGGAKDIGKASKKVYVQMMVAYKDAATQTFSTAVPVIWERPAGFSREIANLLKDYGDLTSRVFKVTRNGVANSMQTTYSISYIPLYDKPESVTTDFSAFNNFNIAKHSFWEKSVGDLNVFLNTGSFPEVARAPQAPTPTDAEAPAYTRFQAPVAPAAQTTPPAAPAFAQPTPKVEAFQAPAQPTYGEGQYVAPPVVPTPAAPAAPAQPTFTPPAAPTEQPANPFGGFQAPQPPNFNGFESIPAAPNGFKPTW
jgi:hypothetical protein